MILYALIVRTKDGMALSTSTDFDSDVNKTLKESKKYVKMVGNKATQLPEKCVLNLVDYNIFMITCIGVSYLVMCESHYSTVLAFSFLNELMKEFTSRYELARVNLARRPYHFIEFDNFIHKTRQRYNKPQSLTTRINLSDLSLEMKLRPAYNLAITDVETVKNGYTTLNIPQLGVGPPPKLQPISCFGVFILSVNLMLILTGLLRGLHTVNYSTVGHMEPYTVYHALVFFLESAVRSFQLYLLLYQSRYRVLESWGCLAVLILTSFLAWSLRQIEVHVIFFLISLSMHLCTINRKLQPKLPNYNV